MPQQQTTARHSQRRSPLMIVLNSAEFAFTVGKKGHKERESRSEANRQPQSRRQVQTQQEQSKYNSKVLCNSCGYTGQSARDCEHRAKGVSVFRNVPYHKQNTDENRNFREEFKSSQWKVPLNEITEQPEFSNSLESEGDQFVHWSRHVTHSKTAKVPIMSYLNPVCMC